MCFKFIDGAMSIERMIEFMADVIEDHERKVFLLFDCRVNTANND
jgi:hypothetical protein